MNLKFEGNHTLKIAGLF